MNARLSGVMDLSFANPLLCHISSSKLSNRSIVEARSVINSLQRSFQLLFPALEFSAYKFSSKDGNDAVSFLAMQRALYANTLSPSITCWITSLIVHLPGAYAKVDLSSVMDPRNSCIAEVWFVHASL